MKLDVYWMVSLVWFFQFNILFRCLLPLFHHDAIYMHIYYYKTLLHNKSNCLRSLAMYTRSAGKFNGCWVEKCCDAVWLCSRMIGAVATWQFSLPFAHRAPRPPPPMYPIFRFPFSEAAAVINRVVMRCQIRIMYVASADHGQTTIKLSTARAVCHTASNFPIVVCTTPHRTESVVEGRTFSVLFHVRWQRVFH